MTLSIVDCDLLLTELIFLKQKDIRSNDKYSYYLYSRGKLTVVLEECFEYDLGGKVNDIIFSGIVAGDMQELSDLLSETVLAGGSLPYIKDFEYQMRMHLHPMYGLASFQKILLIMLFLNIIRSYSYYSQIERTFVLCD